MSKWRMKLTADQIAEREAEQRRIQSQAKPSEQPLPFKSAASCGSVCRETVVSREASAAKKRREDFERSSLPQRPSVEPDAYEMQQIEERQRERERRRDAQRRAEEERIRQANIAAQKEKELECARLREIEDARRLSEVSKEQSAHLLKEMMRRECMEVIRSMDAFDLVEEVARRMKRDGMVGEPWCWRAYIEAIRKEKQ